MREKLAIESIEEGIQGLIIGIFAGIYLDRGMGAPFLAQLALMLLVAAALVIALYILKKSKVEALRNIADDA